MRNLFPKLRDFEKNDIGVAFMSHLVRSAKTLASDLKTVIRKIAYAPLKIQNLFLKGFKSREDGLVAKKNLN